MNARRWLRADVASVALAVALLSYRFCNLDLVTFINDEPHLLAAAEQEAHGQGWVSGSPISGTQGLHYGPVPTWFYGIVHLIFGASPLVSIVAMGLLVTLGQLVFLGLLTRLVRGGPAIFGALLALVASSPFAFAWSRTAWDNTILIGAFACGALLLAEEEITPRRALMAGTLFGISVSTHLMVLPVLIILLAITAWPLRKNLRRLVQTFALIGAPLVLINVPYIFYLAHPKMVIASTTVASSLPHVKPPFDPADAIDAIVTTFLGPARVFTTAGISYFFDDAWNDFRGTLGGATVLLQGAWIAFILAAVAISGLVLTLRKSDDARARKLAILALSSWLGYALFLLIDGLDPHPHYQHPVWWTVPVGLALLFVWLRERSLQKENWLVGALWMLALAQFSFLPLWMHYVRAHGGTQGVHYTTPLADERDWMHRACVDGSGDTRIENHTVIFAAALEYLASTEPACRDHAVTVCAGACASTVNSRIFRLAYADGGGRLAAP